MVALSITVAVMFILIVGLTQNIKKLQDQIELLDREQHTQNKDILGLLEYRNESSTMLLQHREVLEYLMERDPLMNSIKNPMSNIVGKA